MLGTEAAFAPGNKLKLRLCGYCWRTVWLSSDFDGGLAFTSIKLGCSRFGCRLAVVDTGDCGLCSFVWKHPGSAMKEWFEDSSSEEDRADITNCTDFRVRTSKSGKKSLSGTGISAKLTLTMDVVVTVRLPPPWQVVSKRSLMGNVPSSFLSKTDLGGEVGIPCLARSLTKKQGLVKKCAVRSSWRDRPVRASPCGAFRRTLPGELSREIIVAKVECGRFNSVLDKLNATSLGKEIVDDTISSVCNSKWDTRKRVKAARDMIRKGRALEGGLLREHHALSLASHTQVANVIAKCLPMRSVDPFLFMFNSFRPGPLGPALQKQKKRKRRKATVASVAATSNALQELPMAPAPAAFPFENEKVGKTPIAWIDSSLKHAFGNEYVMLGRCQHPDDMYSRGVSHSDLDIVVMDCILSRSCPLDTTVRNKNTRGVAQHVRATPVQVCEFQNIDAVNCGIARRDGNAFDGSPSETKDDDDFYRACIVLLPHAGVFYCHRERRSASTGVLNSHVPIDINWLRCRHRSQGNCFGEGSYVSRLANGNSTSIWKWSIRRSATNLWPIPNAIAGLTSRSQVIPIHNTKQLTDDEGPALPPDYIVGQEEDMQNMDQISQKEAFRDAFSRSMSARLGCRHYAPGFLHKKIDPLTTFVIDPVCEFNELDLHVDVAIPSNKDHPVFHRRSVVQIRYLPTIVGSSCKELLSDINRHCKLVKKERGVAGTRAGHGDLGAMHPIGSRIDNSWQKTQFIASSTSDAVPVLSKAVQAAAKLASVSIPAVLRVIQDFEADSGMKHVGGMVGDGGTCHAAQSMDLSINLANATHYDVNDASQGFSIWTEDNPNTTKDWYFVLPNMTGKFPGTNRKYNGIAIKLSDGVLIGWDGRLIRHGTSMVRSRVGNIYGTFFAAKTRIIKYGMSQFSGTAK